MPQASSVIARIESLESMGQLARMAIPMVAVAPADRRPGAVDRPRRRGAGTAALDDAALTSTRRCGYGRNRSPAWPTRSETKAFAAKEGCGIFRGTPFGLPSTLPHGERL